MFSKDTFKKLCDLNQAMLKKDRLSKITIGQTVWVKPQDYPITKGKVKGIYDHGFNIEITAYDTKRNIAFTWDRVRTLEEGDKF